MHVLDPMTLEPTATASREAAVQATTRPPGHDDCGTLLRAAAGSDAVRRARRTDCSVAPGRTTTCSGPRPAHRDCGWKRDERVVPWTGTTVATAERLSKMGSMTGMALSPTIESGTARLPPLRIVPGLTASARSRHPFRAGCTCSEPWHAGELALRPPAPRRHHPGSRLVQGTRHSLAYAVSPRSRCVRGRQARSDHTVSLGPRSPPIAVLVNSGLTSSASSWKESPRLYYLSTVRTS